MKRFTFLLTSSSLLLSPLSGLACGGPGGENFSFDPPLEVTVNARGLTMSVPRVSKRNLRHYVRALNSGAL